MTTPATLEQIAAIVHRLQSFGRRICWHKEVIFNSADQQKLHELLDDAGNALTSLQAVAAQQGTGGAQSDDFGERVAVNAAILRLFKGEYRNSGDRHSDALFVKEYVEVMQSTRYAPLPDEAKIREAVSDALDTMVRCIGSDDVAYVGSVRDVTLDRIMSVLLPLLAGKVAGGDSRDTERLDWLEAHPFVQLKNFDPHDPTAKWSCGGHYAGTPRQAIDAAMRRAQPEQKGEAQ